MKCKYCGKQIKYHVRAYRSFCPPPAKCKKLYREEHKTERKSRKDSTENEGIFDNFGGREWYDLAEKYCCNFKLRKSEGYCTTLISPITKFTKTCNKCSLGISIKDRIEK